MYECVCVCEKAPLVNSVLSCHQRFYYNLHNIRGLWAIMFWLVRGHVINSSLERDVSFQIPVCVTERHQHWLSLLKLMGEHKGL